MGYATQGAAGGPAQEIKSLTEEITAAVQRVNEMTIQVANYADRLVGSMPRTGAEKLETPPGSVVMNLNRLHQALSGLREEIDRFGRVL